MTIEFTTYFDLQKEGILTASVIHFAVVNFVEHIVINKVKSWFSFNLDIWKHNIR